MGRGGADFVKVEEGKFVKDGKPYYFIGANMWYAALLASEGEGGDRERLAVELDSLQAMGVDNIRVIVGSDGPCGVRTKFEPVMQTSPGVYNDTLLQGLDYLMADLGRREPCYTLPIRGSGRAVSDSISNGLVSVRLRSRRNSRGRTIAIFLRSSTNRKRLSGCIMTICVKSFRG
jgi:hypothetical protein